MRLLSARAAGIAVTQVSGYRGFSNREGLALVAERDLLLPIATAAIAVLRHSWSRLLFRGSGHRPLGTGTHGVAMSQMGC